MADYVPFLSALVALLVGLAIGKLWERYKLREGSWIDRRRTRESPHFILGLNFLVAHQLDRAIDELSRAAALQPEATEIEMILGNLYREKGQVGRAITIHQGLLQRPKLTRLEQAYVLLCLGIDYKRGGFVDRALEAFREVLRYDEKNPYALINLEKLHEEQHQWTDAREIRERLVSLTGPAEQPRHQQILAFLENELGLQAMKQQDFTAAAHHFTAAIERDPKTVPAYLSLGDVRQRDGRTAEAVASWERAIQTSPERAYLAFDRLESLFVSEGAGHRFQELCRRLIGANPQDWRARTALAKHLLTHGAGHEAFDLLLEALSHNPHSLLIHQAIWRTLMAIGLDTPLVQRYVDLARQSVFYLDPHVCQRCHYRSTELLWQCPHCHEWDTFVEDRISPAQETPPNPAPEWASVPVD